MSVQTKEERLAMIKAVAEKVQARKAFKSKLMTKRKLVRRGYDEEAEVRREKARKFDAAIEKLDENYNQWTDSAKYAEEYYGERYRDTTKFDNDWN